MQFPPKLLRKGDKDLEEMLNEDGEDINEQEPLEGDRFSDEEAAEVRDDIHAYMDLAAEAVVIQSAAIHHLSTAPPSLPTTHLQFSQSVTRAMSVLSDSSFDTAGPPMTTDKEDRLHFDEETDNSVSVTTNSQATARVGRASSAKMIIMKQSKPVLTGNRTLKLQQEAPVILHGRTLHKQPKETSEAKPNDSLWMACTDISSGLTRVGRTCNVNILGIQEPMASILRLAISLAEAHIVFGIPDIADRHDPPYTPFELTGLAQFSIDALIMAAEQKGYDGEYNIAHRLEAGSEAEYILPLSNYVTGRSRTYRAKIKEAASNVVPSVLKYDSTTPQEEIQVYASSNNFLYPRLPNNKFDYSQPFGSPTIVEVIKAAFFTPKQYHRTGILLADKCVSSIASAADKREVPLTMLALAATAIEAVLAEWVDQRQNDFAVSVQTPYKEHLTTAADFLVKRPIAYHALAHKIYNIAAKGRISGVQAIAPSTTRGSAHIDWDNIPE
ncbi:hypothetical protein BC628DRAFT_1417744 [Trametes gibbosa]|nr:hypothetical protein BC628DRAFT_1421861 [Trametes gibbosa]KAI0828167.1 hypothetical protein BC628DRAFT_1417744 [Trametes gibbosa]